MTVLLHICCANCAIFPLEQLRSKGEEVVGYFFNPNIHPYQEYEKRLGALKEYSEKVKLEVSYRDEYLLEEFLRDVSRVDKRCGYCYRIRLEATAKEAKKKGFDQFSTTLLQSAHQDHGLIRETAEAVAREVGIPFYYEDSQDRVEEGG